MNVRDLRRTNYALEQVDPSISRTEKIADFAIIEKGVYAVSNVTNYMAHCNVNSAITQVNISTSNVGADSSSMQARLASI